MLRLAVILLGAFFAAAGIILLLCGLVTPGWQVFGVGVVVLLGTLFERWRYRNDVHAEGQGWQRTEERFLDPSTGEPVEVYFDPRTGERRYVSQTGENPDEPPP